MLEVKHLKKTFYINRKRSLTPVCDVSFVLGQGGKIGICGASGEGKSTIAHIITGLIKPNAGNVYLDGNPFYNDKFRYNRKVGRDVQIIHQAPYASLDPSQKIGAAVAEAVSVATKCRNRKQCMERAETLLSKTGLSPDLHSRYPHALSGGQAQRAAIARALALNPRVLISDEATSMLDMSTQAQIINLFLRLNEEDNVSVIFISHDNELLKAVTNTRYVLKDGLLEKEDI